MHVQIFAIRYQNKNGHAYLYSHAKSLGLVFQIKLVCETHDVTANKSYFYETIKNNQEKT